MERNPSLPQTDGKLSDTASFLRLNASPQILAFIVTAPAPVLQVCWIPEETNEVNSNSFQVNLFVVFIEFYNVQMTWYTNKLPWRDKVSARNNYFQNNSQ